MSRDEWVTLPVMMDGIETTTQWRRDDILSYAGDIHGKCAFMSAKWKRAVIVSLPLAEFEALLFGRPERDAYTRAAVRYAEASAVRMNAEEAWITAPQSADPAAFDAAADVEDEARDAFLRLYREKHGG